MVELVATSIKRQHGKNILPMINTFFSSQTSEPSTAADSKTETLGSSGLESHAGNRVRVAADPSLNGFLANGASDAHPTRMREVENKLSAWQNNGWITQAWGVLVLKFGEYHLTQRDCLRKHGVPADCNPSVVV